MQSSTPLDFSGIPLFNRDQDRALGAPEIKEPVPFLFNSNTRIVIRMNVRPDDSSSSYSCSTPLNDESTKHDSKESNWVDVINGINFVNNSVDSESDSDSELD